MRVCETSINRPSRQEISDEPMSAIEQILLQKLLTICIMRLLYQSLVHKDLISHLQSVIILISNIQARHDSLGIQSEPNRQTSQATNELVSTIVTISSSLKYVYTTLVFFVTGAESLWDF